MTRRVGCQPLPWKLVIDPCSRGPDERDVHDADEARPPVELSRRQVLGLGAAAASAAAASTLGVPSPAGADPHATPLRTALGASFQGGGADSLRPAIHPRSDWAGELGVKGELTPEDDVRFLLVHHTASTNDYGPDDVANQIRGFYNFHTGPEKGWSDVAYNFFVDRYGGIWEGRQGSLASPIRGDATGGSQGFALLCSLIGNHHDQAVTAEAQASMHQLLAWLGATYEVDTSVGAQTTFISRGSNPARSHASRTCSRCSGKSCAVLEIIATMRSVIFPPSGRLWAPKVVRVING